MGRENLGECRVDFQYCGVDLCLYYNVGRNHINLSAADYPQIAFTLKINGGDRSVNYNYETYGIDELPMVLNKVSQQIHDQVALRRRQEVNVSDQIFEFIEEHANHVKYVGKD